MSLKTGTPPRRKEDERRREGEGRAGTLSTTSSGLVLPQRVEDPVEEIRTILRVDDDTPVVVLDDYEYDELPIGSGSFSEVYRAVNPEGLVRAIKEFRLGIGARDHRTYAERRKLFGREFRAYRSLGGHEQIPDFHAIGGRLTRDGRFRIFQPGIVMGYVDGKTLADGLKAKEEFSPDEVRDVLMQSLSPLSEIHHGNSVPRYHRDLKPANLKRSSSGRLYVLDFGEIRDSLLRTGGHSGTLDRGTLGYAHRLQLEGEPSFRTDLYSLGRVLYAIATGRDLRSSDRFERKLIDRTNLDSQMRDVIQMLCDESLGGIQDVASLEDYLGRKPIEVQTGGTGSEVGPYETRYDIPVIRPDAEGSLDEVVETSEGLDPSVVEGIERELKSTKKKINRSHTWLTFSPPLLGIGVLSYLASAIFPEQAQWFQNFGIGLGIAGGIPTALSLSSLRDYKQKIVDLEHQLEQTSVNKQLNAEYSFMRTSTWISDLCLYNSIGYNSWEIMKDLINRDPRGELAGLVTLGVVIPVIYAGKTIIQSRAKEEIKRMEGELGDAEELSAEEPKRAWLPPMRGYIEHTFGRETPRAKYVGTVEGIKIGIVNGQGWFPDKLEELIGVAEEFRIGAGYKQRFWDYEDLRFKNRRKRRRVLEEYLDNRQTDEEFKINFKEYLGHCEESDFREHQGDPVRYIKRWKMRRVLSRTKKEFHSRDKYETYSSRLKELPFSPEVKKKISDAMWSAHYDGHLKQEYSTALEKEFQTFPEVREMIEDIAGIDAFDLRVGK